MASNDYFSNYYDITVKPILDLADMEKSCTLANVN